MSDGEIILFMIVVFVISLHIPAQVDKYKCNLKKDYSKWVYGDNNVEYMHTTKQNSDCLHSQN